MVNQKAPKTLSQKAYAAKKQKIDELKAYINKVSRAAAKSWQDNNPDCKDLAVKPLNLVYIKRKGAITKAILDIAQRMAYPSNREKTQAAILEDIKPDYLDITLHPSLWQKELPASLMKKIATIVNGNLRKPINFKECKTLSQVRQKIKTVEQVERGSRTFKVEITITNDFVSIGKEVYTLEKRTSGYAIRVLDKNGKRRLVNMDGLAAALLKA